MNAVATQPEEVVVTAQRRSEKLNKVPIAITVIGGSRIRNTNTTRLEQIQQLAPSIQYTATQGAPTFQIRGIGTTSYDFSVEQAVGIAVDDVNITLPRINPLFLLADISQIEVLRGPQGLLFGKNTTAGLISIATSQPQLGVFSNEVYTEYGSRNELETYDVANIPVSDTVAVRLRAGYQQQDTPLKNLSTGSLPNPRGYDFNGKMLWEPNDRLSVLAIANYQGSHPDPGVPTVKSYDPDPGATFAPGRKYGAPRGAPDAGGPDFIRQQLSLYGIKAGPFNNEIAQDAQTFENSQYFGGQLSVNYRLDGGQTITSVTSYHQGNINADGEVDLTPLRVLDVNNAVIRASELTQELRIASPSGGLFDYVGGLYFYDQEVKANQQQAGTLGLLPNNSPIIVQPTLLGGQYNFLVGNKSYAAFVQGTYHVTDRFRAVAGVRITDDDVNGSTNITHVPGICGAAYGLVPLPGFCQVNGTLAHLQFGATLPSPTLSGAASTVGVSVRTGLEYDLDPHSMAYFTFTRGYKGPAVSTVSDTIQNVRPEIVLAYELGVKSTVLDSKLDLTAALFRSDFSDFQAQVFDPNVGLGAFVSGNAGGLRTQGVELESTYRPMHGLALTSGVTFEDAFFTNYNPSCYPGQTVTAGCNYAANPSNPTFNAVGDQLPSAPRWTAIFNGSYQKPINDALVATANVNWSYRSAVLYDVGDPGTRQNGYSLTNLNVGIGNEDGRWRTSLFVRNLFDKRFASSIFPTFFDVGGYSQILTQDAFRTVGFSIDVKF